MTTGLKWSKTFQKERQNWVKMSRVLIREGVYARTSGSIYVAVSQVIMLYRLETWVMTLLIGRVLGQFPPQGGPQADGKTI